MPGSTDETRCACGCGECEGAAVATVGIVIKMTMGTVEAIPTPVCVPCLVNTMTSPADALPDAVIDLVGVAGAQMEMKIKAIPGAPLFSDDPRIIAVAKAREAEVAEYAARCARHSNN